MTSLKLLRKLAEYQQYAELQEACAGIIEADSDAGCLALLTLAQAQLGERLLAEASLRRAMVRQAEFDDDVWVDVAAVYILLQDSEAAEAVLEPLLARRPEHALALARLGYCRMLQDESEAATRLYRQSLEIEPGRIPLYSLLTQVFRQQARYDLAQETLDRGLQMLAAKQAELPDFVFHQYRRQLLETQLAQWVEVGDFAPAEHWLEAQYADLETDEFAHWLTGYSRLLAERDLHPQATDILREYLKRLPDNSLLYLRLAELIQLQGQFLPAVRLLRRALKQEPEDIGLWVQLSSACLHRFDGQARQAAERALTLAEALQVDEAHPEPAVRLLRAQAKNALAQVDAHDQHYELSEGMFREILADHAYFVPALQGLGQQLMQQGRIDEALALFERIEAVDPVKGHTSLIGARRFPEDEETLAKLERAAHTPSLEGRVRAGILFQLAAARDRRGDYDKAFDCAQRANMASKQFLSYDGRAHRDQCARIRQRFCRALYEHRPGCGVDSSLPVYVVGMPRSGTTLVEQIIAGHSRIFGAGELGLIPQVVQGLNRWERHVGSARGYPDCVDDLTPYVTEGIANNILNELRDYAPEAQHVVDKLPHNFEHIGLIKFLFPHAKIISVRRDPRDIAISNYFTDYQAKHSGMGFAYDLTDIGEQLADHNLLMHHWHRLFPGEILELDYEQVVDDLEGSARRLLDFIGVDWEPQVLQFNELDRPVRTASLWQVRQPIYTGSKAKWMRYREYLQPLIRGTNAKIVSDPNFMLSLPEPGFLTEGVALYRRGDLDGAELSFKKMLHHNPAHAACRYMVGLIYLHKGHLEEGIELIEQALDKAPWHKEWRENLLKACRLTGREDRVAELQTRVAGVAEDVSEEAYRNEEDSLLEPIYSIDENYRTSRIDNNP